MEFKDYYAALGVERTASQDEIKRAYRKLARKYHPDVSKEANAEARFKEVAEAHEALIDPERRAAYDAIGQRQERGQPFEPPPGWDSGFEFSGRGDGGMPGGGNADFSDFFSSLFGRAGMGERANRASPFPSGSPMPAQGRDHHAKVVIDLLDAYRGAQRTITLRVPVTDAQGHTTLQERRLDVNIPKGIRPGQHLRLNGQGAAGQGGAPAGDLYLEIQFQAHPKFRVEGSDLYLDLPVAPWEAALGATLTIPTPEGDVQLSVPAGSTQGRKLRLKGRGLPGKQPGDLYAVLGIVQPAAVSEQATAAYRTFAQAFPDFTPRKELEA